MKRSPSRSPKSGKTKKRPPRAKPAKRTTRAKPRHRRAYGIITNKYGLSARESAACVCMARTFDARIVIKYDGQSASATDLMDLYLLGLEQGSRFTILATGREAKPAVRAISELFATGLTP